MQVDISFFIGLLNMFIVLSTTRISAILLERAFSMLLREDFFYRFSGRFKDYKKCLKTLHDFTDNVIMTRRNELEKIQITNRNDSEDNSETKGKKAFLDILLQAATPDGKPLSNEDIREEVDTFMFEGHDTTTSGISFCLYNIAKYPEVQKKVFAEIEDQIEFGQKLTMRELSKLSYLELVIKESLRLYPSVPYFSRRLVSGDLQVGEHLFPKNSSINISPYLMGRNETVFKDPLEFIPERFNIETTSEKVNPYAYVPFSAGPRNCKYY